ncbi:hypothetical protein PYH37_000887 [Sinorhizobium numidicum]|uniref:Uncharacterized protein n=1 Tax=Sinorhizobium numidicum TaxID=680248 RepID=A0ABY8CVJ9_9HYPH|nr:hypothetical protein [Sinorhizobium numidicum]WEX75470.1 hypothetical protein PYH37_000887 [Sinorhizobium numidicum]WEX81467.1 hypothetical protein PYH38_000888 [Sinorhizobium numidicum]
MAVQQKIEWCHAALHLSGELSHGKPWQTGHARGRKTPVSPHVAEIVPRKFLGQPKIEQRDCDFFKLREFFGGTNPSQVAISRNEASFGQPSQSKAARHTDSEIRNRHSKSFKRARSCKQTPGGYELGIHGRSFGGIGSRQPLRPERKAATRR